MKLSHKLDQINCILNICNFLVSLNTALPSSHDVVGSVNHLLYAREEMTQILDWIFCLWVFFSEKFYFTSNWEIILDLLWDWLNYLEYKNLKLKKNAYVVHEENL